MACFIDPCLIRPTNLLDVMQRLCACSDVQDINICCMSLSIIMLAGLPVFTGPVYGWKGSQNGVLLGVLGIASLPVSFFVGYISPHVSDCSLTLAAVLVTAVGAVLCTQAGLHKLAAAYFGGGGMLYLVRLSHSRSDSMKLLPVVFAPACATQKSGDPVCECNVLHSVVQEAAYALMQNNGCQPLHSMTR